MSNKRRISKLLPEFMQRNSQLAKFFSSTVDPLFQPESKKKQAGYIGRIPSYYDEETDKYVIEPTAERQFYQLEPSMISSTADNIENIQTYTDLINHLRFQGANVDDHSRLFEQNYYSWAPPIDIDKFTNFNNYYWYPEGPTAILIDGNASLDVDVADILGSVNYVSPNGISLISGMKITFGSTYVTPASYQSQTYIVEGVGTSILLVDVDSLNDNIIPLQVPTSTEVKDYVTIGRGAADNNPWARSNHWYHKNTLALLSDTGVAATEVAFLWDATVEPWDSTPWDAVTTTQVPAFILDPSRKAHRSIIEFDRTMELYNYGIVAREVSYIDTSTVNAFTDIHSQPFGTVTIDGSSLIVNDTILLTVATNPSVNDRVYTVGSIELTPNNFVYTLTLNTDGASPVGDPVLKEKVLQVKGDAAGIEYYFDGTTYITTQRKTSVNQAPLFNLYDIDGNYLADENLYPLSTFIGSKVFSYKDGDQPDSELKINVEYRNFNQVAEIVFNHDLLDRETYEFTSLTRKTIEGYYFYKTGNTYGNSWNASSTKSTQSNDEGFYSIPLNLQANPDYLEVENITRSEALGHFASIITQQDNIIGTGFANTNYRNTAKDVSKGNIIVHNEASMLKLMMMASDENYDYMQSVSHNANEYKRFKNRFVNKAKNLLDSGQDITDIPQFVDDIMGILNVTKQSGSLFPFKNTRVAAFGKDYTSVSYTAAGSTFAFPVDVTFDVAKVKQKDAINVYKNKTILLVNYDYTIVGSNIVLTDANILGDTLEIRYYTDIMGSYIPATGAVLGLTPVYKPEMYADDTYSPASNVIQCHDGSLHFNYNDVRDDVVLELETRIYNSVQDKFKGDNRVNFDVKEVLPGYFRSSSYDVDTINEILTPIFTTWATDNKIDWTPNTEDQLFDQGDWKTWNWTGTPTIDGSEAKGSWRAIYKHYFDTDRPHTHPWEMLGFTEQPSWWVSEYGTDYGSNNITLWDDLRQGLIKQGTRAGVDALYTRDTLNIYHPVDANGDLVSPTTAGITRSNANVVDAQADWSVGDMSPSETAFWKSSETSFFLSKLAYALRPAKWVNFGWNTETFRYLDIVDQYIDTDFGIRPLSEDMTITDDGIIKHGIAEWIANTLESDDIDVATTLELTMQGLNVSLTWKAAAFIYNQNLTLQADSYSPSSKAVTQTIFVRDDDVDLALLESNSIKEAFYGGVIVKWTGTGYEVTGYDTVEPSFSILTSDNQSKFSTISVGSTSVKQYSRTGDETTISYGHEFTSKQDVFEFLIGYGRKLEQDGWVFEDYDPTSNEILNWRYSGKEFLFWSEDKLLDGAFITLSPSANKLTFNSMHGMVQNVERISRGTYSILNGVGEPINTNLTDVYRDEDSFTVTDLSEEGIYALRLSIKEIENVIVLKNITRFNDTIYNPLLNLRQQRLKVFAQVADGWKGRYEAAGFMIDRNSDKNLIPNFEKTASDFRNYFDVENASENDDITDIARHQIGYQTRDYLDNLLIDRDSQYQFYQGFIQQKGSRNTLNRMFRSTAITSSSDVSFLEEWAFRVGEYGAVDSKKYFELRMVAADIKSNPQIVRFTSGSKSDVSSDVIIDVGLSDNRWYASNDVTSTDKFITRAMGEPHSRDLPNAGFVMRGETNHTIPYSRDLVTSSLINFANTNDTVWIATDKEGYLTQSKWDVQVLTSIDEYAFTDDDDTTKVRLYDRFSFTGDGVQTVYNINPAESRLVNNYLYFVDGVQTTFVSSSFNIVTFDTAPVDGSVVDIYAVNYAPNVEDLMRFGTGSELTTHMVESVTDEVIQLREFNGIAIETYSETAVGIWKSLRFASDNTLDRPARIAAWPNNYLYFDTDETGTGWTVRQSTVGISSVIRSEKELVDTYRLNNAVLFDYEKDIINTRATIFDPFKGIIPGVADADITYKLEYDPARYNSGVGVSIDEREWGNSQTGKVWWDLSTTAYLYYEMGDLEYKYQNWGAIFPDTTIDVYEWVRSPVSPDKWTDYVGASAEMFDYKESGTVKDIDTTDGPKWTERLEDGKTFYYFWIKDKIGVPNLPFRATSILDIAKIITNPQGEGIKWASAINTDAFIISNIETDLSDETTVLQFNYTQTDTDSAIHHQWELLRENDEFSNINNRHWNKMRDSLVGYDDFGKEVPDARLFGNSKYGHHIRPRQTWFTENISARQVFIEAVNTIIKDINLTDSVLDYETVLNSKDTLSVPDTKITGTVANPTVSTGDQFNINANSVVFSGINGVAGIADDINYAVQGSSLVASIEYVGVDSYITITETDGNRINIVNTSGTALTTIGLPSGITEGMGPDHTVATRTARGLLLGLEVGDSVMIENDEVLFQYWTLWEYLGGSPIDSDNWALTTIQSYDTTKYWEEIDWYASGYTADDASSIIFTTLAERNAGDTEIGGLVKVLDDNSGVWAWYVKTDETWLLVAKENATLRFLDTLYDPALYGYDQELLDALPFDDIPNIEFRKIMDAVRDNILVGSFITSQNSLFFKMVNHAHTTNNQIDWAFKTSYLFVVGFSENLQQTPIFTGDGFEAMIDYINEAKPYHSKIKDIMRTFATVVDNTDVTMIDYDNPTVDGTPLSLTDSDDLITLNTDPWNNWLGEYQLDLRPDVKRANNVRKAKSTVKFDRISAVREDYIPAVTFPTHPDYPDVLSPTPYYVKATDSTTAKDNRNISFLDSYMGTLDEMLYDGGNGYDFFWKLDTLNDASANANHATMVAGAATYGDSIIPMTSDQSFIFDGQREMSAPNHNDINLVDYTKKSFTFVFNASRVHAASPQVIFKQGGATNGINITVHRSGSEHTLYATIYEAAGVQKDILSVSIKPDTTYFVSFEFDALAGTSSLYVNGELVDSAISLNVTDPVALDAGLLAFGGPVSTDIIGPLDNTALDYGTSKFQGRLQYFAYYNEKNVTTEVALWNASQFTPEIFNIGQSPSNKYIILDTSGIINSTIIIVGNTEPDFSGTDTIISTITQTGNILIRDEDLEDSPFLRVDVSGFVYGDNITLITDVVYDNTLSRLLDYYKPTQTMPSLVDLMESYYLGTILDGFSLLLDQGWDASPWEFAGWDYDGDIADLFDVVLVGGSYDVHVGDNTVNTFNLPSYGVAPWYVSTTDDLGVFIQELVVDVDYSIVGTQLVLIDAGQSWLTAGNLTLDFKLTIMDSTYLSINDYEVIVDGHAITSPHVSGYPEEIAPLVMTDSTVITVVTSGSINQTIFTNVTDTITSDVFTFNGETPVDVVISGIAGDTVLIQGSDTGAFLGEQTTIATVIASGTEAGITVFPYYRVVVANYISGSITVTANINIAALTTNTYRELVSSDNNEAFHEIVRFGDSFKTTITSSVINTDNVIEVTDASIFAADGGIVWIDAERIDYNSRTGGATPGASGTLLGLTRGSRGTRKLKTHTVGATIRVGDHVIEHGPELMFNEVNTRLQLSSTPGATYLLGDSGGYGSWV